MENPIKMDDLGGNTPIFGNTHIVSNPHLQVIIHENAIWKGRNNRYPTWGDLLTSPWLLTTVSVDPSWGPKFGGGPQQNLEEALNPSEKYARQNGFIFPNFRGENSKNV